MNIVVPIHVDWKTMLRGKLAGAMRPSRLLAMAVAVVGIGVFASTFLEASLTSGLVGAFTGFTLFRLSVMLLAGALDKSARRFNGALTLNADGLAFAKTDGSSEVHPWSWVLDVKDQPAAFALRLDERGGRMWLFLTKRGLEQRGQTDALRDLLGNVGRL
jgi:hypothetical protein